MTAQELPAPTKDTIARHLRYAHGYELEYTVAEHPTVLLGQHERIHQQFSTFKMEHTHAVVET